MAYSAQPYLLLYGSWGTTQLIIGDKPKAEPSVLSSRANLVLILSKKMKSWISIAYLSSPESNSGSCNEIAQRADH